MTAAATCAHCGLALAAGPDPRVDAAGRAFCCGGCETVYALLKDAGLASYHAFGERRAGPAVASGKSYLEFDHPTFERLHVQARPDGLREAQLHLEGVQCASCVWLLERAPRLVPGLVAAEVDLGRGRIVLTWDPARVRLSRIASVLDGLGYRPHPFRGLARDAQRRDEERRMLLGLGVAGALAGNVMTIALATYAGWFGHMDVATERYFRIASLVLTLPSVLGPGRVFFRGAWAALRTRTLHMDVPIALALFAGVARGAANVLSGHGPVYFDGVALLVFLLLVGRFLQLKAQRAALDATELGAALTPRTAWLVAPAGEGGAEAVHEVPAEALLPGSVVEVRSGETLPADGVVVRGTSALDLSLLTGESRPVRASAGDTVWAGTVNRGALVRVRVERAGEETRVARLVAEVEAGARKRAPVVQLADRLAGRFVLVVLALAAVTWLAWRNVDSAAAIDRAIALLIVTCPCALALATPLAVTVALGRAARAGILIKSGAALERLARPARILLDKTGTLTEGRLALVAAEGDPSARAAVVALERHARHPVADALVAAWGDAPAVDALVASDVVVTPGGGVEGRVGGHAWVVGSPAFVRARAGVAAPAGESAAAEELTPVVMARDGALVGRAWFDDPLRPDARAALATLVARGDTPAIVSGDARAVVAKVARALGLPAEAAEAEVSPEAKVAVVERELAQGPVIMVGDGVNDAAAMARASVGVAVKGGAEASLEAADVYLSRPGLAPLVELVEGSARTLGVIRRNVAFSLAYNLVGAGLAVTGIINPLWAAVLMPLSSLTVVLASWTARTFDAPAPALPTAGLADAPPAADLGQPAPAAAPLAGESAA